MAVAGDDRAFGQLAKRTSRKVLNTTFNMTHDPHDAEDARQDAFLRAFKSVRGYQGDASFHTWMHTVTRSQTLNFIEKRRKHNHGHLPEDEVLLDKRPESDPERMAQISSLREQLQFALESLTEADRHIIDLGYFRDLPVTEIADVLQVSTDVAKKRLHRARIRLKKKVLEITNIATEE
jgi:RNA polymerase sigma-70 factor, ECF subfamily